MPYFPYSRQDKLGSSRTALASKLITKMIQISGADRIMTVNAHSEDICSYSHVPLLNLECDLFLMKSLIRWVKIQKSILIAPDAGSMKSCSKIMKYYDLAGGMIYKGISSKYQLYFYYTEREHKNDISKMYLAGLVKGKDCVIFDDIGDTFSTISEASTILKQKGARYITAVIIHNIFSQHAIENLFDSSIDTLIFTNTTPNSSKLNVAAYYKIGFHFEVVDISKFLGDQINIFHKMI